MNSKVVQALGLAQLGQKSSAPLKLYQHRLSGRLGEQR
jgi:hypothetical protein